MIPPLNLVLTWHNAQLYYNIIDSIPYAVLYSTRKSLGMGKISKGLGYEAVLQFFLLLLILLLLPCFAYKPYLSQVRSTHIAQRLICMIALKIDTFSETAKMLE